MVAASAASADFSRYSKPPPLGGGAFTTNRAERGVPVALAGQAPALCDALVCSHRQEAHSSWAMMPSPTIMYS